MRYDLTAMAKRAGPSKRRKAIVLRDTPPPAVLATDLYRSTYANVVAAWTAAAPRIIATYERSLADLVQDSPADVRAEIDGAAEQIIRLVLLLTPSLRDWALRVEQHSRRAWRGAVLSATGVDLEVMLGPEDMRATIDTYLSWNTDLIADVSNQIKQRVSSSVFSGLTQRKPAREVAKEIREATGLARDRSLRIASDQLSKLSGALAEERQREAGIDQVIWRASRKLHARPHHAARDGKRYYLETKKAVDGSETVASGDWVQQPPFCGCRTQAYIDLMGD